MSRVVSMKKPHIALSPKNPCYNPGKISTLEGLLMPFAEKLSTFRNNKGYTQQEMAKKIGIGIAQIRRYEAGKSSPTLEVIRNIAKTLGVSTDELIFDRDDELSSAKISDRKLLEQFEMIAKLNPHDKDAVKTILESVIIKSKLEEIVPFRSDAAWSKEMRKAVSELRKGAEQYSDEEIESIVDEAVTAVRAEERKKVGH